MYVQRVLHKHSIKMSHSMQPLIAPGITLSGKPSMMLCNSKKISSLVSNSTHSVLDKDTKLTQWQLIV